MEGVGGGGSRLNFVSVHRIGSYNRADPGGHSNLIVYKQDLYCIATVGTVLLFSITVLTSLWLYVCQSSNSTTKDTLNCLSKLPTEDNGREMEQLQVVGYFAFKSFLKYVLIMAGLIERNLNTFSSLSLRIYLICFPAGTDWLASDLFMTFLILSRKMMHSEHSFFLSNNRQQSVNHASSCHTNLLKGVQLFYTSVVCV